jgi:outer membrane protein OmpA-like peptidoglycan-associated protein
VLKPALLEPIVSQRPLALDVTGIGRGQYTAVVEVLWPVRARVIFLAAFLAAFPPVAFGQSELAGESTAMTLQVFHHQELGSSFAIRSATYLLDGKPILSLGGAELRNRLANGPQLHQMSLTSGAHVIALQIVYEGTSGVFQYLGKYRFTMKGYLLVESKPGYRIQVISKGVERPWVEKWQNRPSFKLAGLPEKAILRVRVSPVERVEARGDDNVAELQPVAITVSEEDARLLEEYVAHQVPPPSPGIKVAQVQVEASGCGPVIVHFPYRRATLKRPARRALEALAACLLRSPEKSLRVEGHCDERGSDALNDRLSDARAKATVSFLILRGIMPGRMRAVSFGKRRSTCGEQTEECYSRNRRAELIDTPSGSPAHPPVAANTPTP